MIKTFYDFMVIPLMVSHHRTKFGGHRHCGKGDIMVLVCQEILQNHIIKRSCYFMGRPIKASYHTATFSNHNLSGRGVMILVVHVILQDHMIKESCDFMG